MPLIRQLLPYRDAAIIVIDSPLLRRLEWDVDARVEVQVEDGAIVIRKRAVASAPVARSSAPP